MVSWARKDVGRFWEVNDNQANCKALNFVQDTAEDSGLWGPVPPSCMLLFHSLQDYIVCTVKAGYFPLVTDHSDDNELWCLNVCTSSFLSLLEWQ